MLGFQRHIKTENGKGRELLGPLGPLDPANYGEIRFASSVRTASEIINENESLRTRAASMADHPSTQVRHRRAVA